MTAAKPGYDAMASAYDAAFPAGYSDATEQHATALFAAELLEANLPGPLLDIGCGAGHVASDLASQGLKVVGIDPSPAMLAMARERYPNLTWLLGDAGLSALSGDYGQVAGIVARYSLIHIEPHLIPSIVTRWVKRLQPGARVMVAFQCSDDASSAVIEFDHRVDRAWRWHPDAMSEVLASAGLSERWRLTTRPNPNHRFAECHLTFER